LRVLSANSFRNFAFSNEARYVIFGNLKFELDEVGNAKWIVAVRRKGLLIHFSVYFTFHVFKILCNSEYVNISGICNNLLLLGWHMTIQK
jgi:hypothetical protein